MTKSEQKQVARATAQGRGALLRTLAILHRSGSTRTQREIESNIEAGQCWDEFIRRNGCLLHVSEA